MWRIDLVALIITELVFSTKALTVRLESTEHALSHVTVVETEIQTTGEQLLVLTGHGLSLISLQSNSSTQLMNGSFTDVAYESVHGEVVTLVEYGNKIQVILLWDSNDLLRPVVSLKLEPRPCWDGWAFENEPSTFRRCNHRRFCCNAQGLTCK